RGRGGGAAARLGAVVADLADALRVPGVVAAIRVDVADVGGAAAARAVQVAADLADVVVARASGAAGGAARVVLGGSDAALVAEAGAGRADAVVAGNVLAVHLDLVLVRPEHLVEEERRAEAAERPEGLERDLIDVDVVAVRVDAARHAHAAAEARVAAADGDV